MAFPQRRLRRLRRTPALRRLVAEARVTVDDLVAPLFVREGITEPQPIASLPGVVQHTRESLRKEVAELAALGVPGVILFGVPATKDPEGSGAWDPDGIVQLALADLRAEVGDDVVVMADLCLDEYTDHGHCGVVRAEAKRLAGLGVPGVILFGVPARKDPVGSGAWDPDGVVASLLAHLGS